MLTPEQVAQMDAITGIKTPAQVPNQDAGAARIAELRKLAGTAPKPKVSLGQKTASIYQESGKKIVESVERGAQRLAAVPETDASFGAEMKRTGALLETGLGVAAAGARGVFAPFEATVSKVGEMTGLIDFVKHAAQSEEGQKYIAPLAKWAEENPDAARNLSDAMVVATAAVGGGGGAKNLLNADIGATTKTVMGAVKEVPGQVARGAEQFGAAREAGKLAKDTAKITDIVSPKVTPVKGAKDIISGRAEVEVPGMVKKGKISYANDPQTQRIVEATKDIIDPNAKTISENFNHVKGAIENTAENTVKPFLSGNKVPFNFQDLRTRFEQVHPQSSLKADAPAFATYDRVRNEMLDDVANYVRQNSGTENITDMNVLWDARKVIDTKIENELGQAALGTPQYTGVKAAARDMRTTFNKFITDSLANPGQAETMNKMYDFLQVARSRGMSIANEGEAMTALRQQFGVQDFADDVAKAAFYKDQIERMSLMYRALDNMAPRVLGEAKKSMPEIWIRNHPLAAKALGFTAAGVAAKLGWNLTPGLGGASD